MRKLMLSHNLAAHPHLTSRWSFPAVGQPCSLCTLQLPHFGTAALLVPGQKFFEVIFSFCVLQTQFFE